MAELSSEDFRKLSFSEELERLERMTDASSQPLLHSIQARLPELRTLLETASSHWHGEDSFYRFYHQSFKLYNLQHDTLQIVEALRAIAPDKALNPWFEQIVTEGTSKSFRPEVNEKWLKETRSILEAFFHARTMLEMAVKYGTELHNAPAKMPSGWAALLYLYGMR